MKKTKVTLGTAMGIIIAIVVLFMIDGGVMNLKGSDTVQAGQAKSNLTLTQKKANSRGRNLTNIWGDTGYVEKGCYTGNNYYYAIYNKIYKLNLLTGKKTMIKEFTCFNINQILFYNNTLYFVEDDYSGTGGTNPYVSKMSINGKNYKRLCEGDSISIAGGRIVYRILKSTTNEDDFWDTVGIGTMSVSGGNKKTLLKSSQIYRVISDGQHVYYSNNNGMYRTDLLGKIIKKVIDGSSNVVGLYKNEMYYTTYNVKGDKCTLLKKNLKTNKKTRVVKNVEDSAAVISTEDGCVYYAEKVAYGKKAPVYKMNLKTQKKTLLFKQSKIFSLSVYGKNITYNYTTKDCLVASKMFSTKTKKKVSLGTYYVS